MVYCEIHVSVLWGNVFVKQSSDVDKQEGFSSEKCVVDYENAVYSGLTKWLLYVWQLWHNITLLPVNEFNLKSIFICAT